ncbi:hypothetical protein EV360DRAFT_79654 [Lentinula raphanica]|nr:hypothetical protein EV360DRAFT_79654 [Lentinula raphanica]
MSSLRLPPRFTRIPDEGVRLVDSDQISTTTYSTTETESSATTVWGPGTLSGRAIKSLGEASLRGVEKLIVRWRLAKINAILPGLTSPTSSSSKNYTTGEQLEKIYDDLLELSRLDFYDTKVRQKALRMIMMQIGSRETHQLLLCVAKWPQEEIIVFLSEMFPCIPLLWYTDQNTTAPAVDADTKARLELIAEYRSSLLPSETHEVLPFIEFISRLAQEHENSCRAVIESGILDALSSVCEHCALAPGVVTKVEHAIGVLMTCQRNWDIECAPQRLDLVWPRSDVPSIPLGHSSSKMTHRAPNDRKILWQISASTAIIERLSEIAVIMGMPEVLSGCDSADMFDLVFDLLVFCDDIRFTGLSMLCLVQIIAIGRQDLQRTLEIVLTLLPYHKKLDFFYRIIHPLWQVEFIQVGLVTMSEAQYLSIYSRLEIEPMPTAITFCKTVTARDLHLDPINVFIDFSMNVADRSHENAQAIVDAEIISLIDANRARTPNIGYVLQRIQNAVEQCQSPMVRRPRSETV